MKRSEMTELVMKAHSEGVYIEDVFEEAFQRGRLALTKEIYEILNGCFGNNDLAIRKICELLQKEESNNVH